MYNKEIKKVRYLINLTYVHILLGIIIPNGYNKYKV